MDRAQLLLGACVLIMPLTTHAQTAAQAAEERQSGDGVADIVVTAQRRAQNLQDVPIAVSAFDSAELQSRGILNTLDVIQFVPNLFGSNNTGLGSANAYYLRGLGNTETIATFDPPVGTYIDEIYLSRQNANNFQLFDVERIEVLRGPQGTLFGRNTTGGAISVKLREPGNDFGGYLEAGYGAFNRVLTRASVDLPVGQQVSVKLSGYYQRTDGYVRNITTGDRLNDDDGWGVRGAVKIDLSDRVRWNGSHAHIVSEAENVLNFDCNPASPRQCDGRFASTGLREGFRLATSPYPAGIVGRKALFGQHNLTEQDISISNFEAQLSDSFTINVITGYVSLRQQFALDFADGRQLPAIGPRLDAPTPNVVPAVPAVRGFPRGGFTILNDGSHQQITQEVKLNGKLFDDRLTFVTGYFYFDETNRTDFADVFSIFIPGVPGGLGLTLGDRLLRNTTIAHAGYAQGDFEIAPRLTVTAGIRYTDETKRLSIRDQRAACQSVIGPTCLDTRNLIAANGARIPTVLKTSEWTPRFVLGWKPTDDYLVFASATRGFKSGGWNARATAPSGLLPFGPETVWSYEIGAKTQFLDNRLRMNITGYYSDVADLQTPSALVAPNGTVSFITRNFADYENKGVELEITAVPVRGLNIYANVGYQDDRYIIDRGASAVDEFGIQSVSAQQAACRAALAAGQVPQGANTAPPALPGQPPNSPNNAPACGAGIISADGSIATPVRTPDWSLAIGATYDIPLGSSGLSLQPSVNGTYRSGYETGTANLTFFDAPVSGVNGSYPTSPFGGGRVITGSLGDSYWLLNASLSLQGPGNTWALTVECQNCLDQDWVQSSLVNYTYLNAPGSWTVRGRFRF